MNTGDSKSTSACQCGAIGNRPSGNVGVPLFSKHNFRPPLIPSSISDARGEYLWPCRDPYGVPMIVYSFGDHLLPEDYWNERYSNYSRHCMIEIANMPAVAPGFFMAHEKSITPDADYCLGLLDFLFMCSRGFPVGFVGGCADRSTDGFVKLMFVPAVFCSARSLSFGFSDLIGGTTFDRSLAAIRDRVEQLAGDGGSGQWSYMDFKTIMAQTGKEWEMFESAISSADLCSHDQTTADRDLESEFSYCAL